MIPAPLTPPPCNTPVDLSMLNDNQSEVGTEAALYSSGSSMLGVEEEIELLKKLEENLNKIMESDASSENVETAGKSDQQATTSRAEIIEGAVPSAASVLLANIVASEHSYSSSLIAPSDSNTGSGLLNENNTVDRVQRYKQIVKQVVDEVVIRSVRATCCDLVYGLRAEVPDAIARVVSSHIGRDRNLIQNIVEQLIKEQTARDTESTSSMQSLQMPVPAPPNTPVGLGTSGGLIASSMGVLNGVDPATIAQSIEELLENEAAMAAYRAAESEDN